MMLSFKAAKCIKINFVNKLSNSLPDKMRQKMTCFTQDLPKIWHISSKYNAGNDGI